MDCSRICRAHRGIRSPEHPEKEHRKIRDRLGRREIWLTGAVGIILRVGRVMKDQADWDRGHNREVENGQTSPLHKDPSLHSMHNASELGFLFCPATFGSGLLGEGGGQPVPHL